MKPSEHQPSLLGVWISMLRCQAAESFITLTFSTHLLFDALRHRHAAEKLGWVAHVRGGFIYRFICFNTCLCSGGTCVWGKTSIRLAWYRCQYILIYIYVCVCVKSSCWLWVSVTGTLCCMIRVEIWDTLLISLLLCCNNYKKPVKHCLCHHFSHVNTFSLMSKAAAEGPEAKRCQRRKIFQCWCRKFVIVWRICSASLFSDSDLTVNWFKGRPIK